MPTLKAVTLVTMAVVCGHASSAAADVVTYHNDNARTGQQLNETVLTPSSVSVATFGKIGFFPVDGKVDAQPLYLAGVPIPGQGGHNVLYVVTEHDSVYAFDARTGAVLWHVSLLGPGETTGNGGGCSQVEPEIGITSTPVIDRARGPNGAMYVVAMSKDGSGQYFQRLHALDVTSGAPLFGSPQVIQASFPGTGDNSNGTSVIFDPRQYKERSALLLLSGMVITVWASHCDIRPYTGWIIAYDAATLAQTSVLNVTPNGSEGALWMSGAGPAGDPAGNIYLLDANGTFDTALDGNGFPSRGDYGNAFLKLSTSAGLAVADYFATFDTVQQSNVDADLGSGGAMVLPDLIDGLGQTRHLSVGAGKDAHIYVADRDSMGKWDPNFNHIYQEISGGGLAGAVFSMPAYFKNTVYFGAVGDAIKAFSIASARLSSTPTSQTAHAFGYPGATPSISANGSANAILWAVENTNPAVLHAYEAGDLSHELYNSNQAGSGRDAFGAGNKFITPTIVNGRVYVGTTNGVAVFGLFQVAPPVAASVAGDFDGDGRTDLALYRPSTGTWYVRLSSTGFTGGVGYAWGVSTDVPVPGDYDGDGKTDLAVYRPSTGTWYILFSSTGFTGAAGYAWGVSTDVPVPGDYDGDGKTDLAVYRPSTGTWYLRLSSTGFTGGPAYAWGVSTDVPVPGDYDGDGKTDLAVFRPSTGTWYLRLSSTGFTGGTGYAWGVSTDVPVPGDYDGDGKTDLAVFRPSTGTWFIRSSSSGFTDGVGYAWGVSTDVPVPGDYDGDGKTDLAVFRPSTGTWYLRFSSTGFTGGAGYAWGTTGDIPVLERR
jgi:hypothetical protein